MSVLREIWAYRELLIILVQRDLKVRYKNSVLGFGWSLLNPLAQVLIITMVLKFLMAAKAPNYHAYVFCAMLPWIFFSTAIMDSSSSLLQYQNLIRRTYFPREIIPLAVVAANLIHFLLATVVFLLYITANSLFWWGLRGQLDWAIQPTVLLIPLPILGLTLLVSGLAMFVSVWTLYFEDIRFLTDSALKMLYWLVPVLYFSDIILELNPQGRGGLFYTLYMLNPLSGFMTAFRKLTLPPTLMPGQSIPSSPMGGTEWLFLAAAFLTSGLLLWLGMRYYGARKWALAEHG
jgi:lipopolysaccharide transport system permease protein